MNRKNIKFSFLNGRGQTLAGLLDLPDGVPLLYGIFAPCFTCTKESHAAHKVCRALAEKGIAMLRFDMTGLGESGGDFADTNFTTRIADIVAAGLALEKEYQAPALLIGHSISGTAAFDASRLLPGVRVLATLGAPRDPAYIIDKFRRNNQIAIKGDRAELTVAGRKVPVRKTFVDDLLAQDVAAATAVYAGKLFVFHAPQDDIAGFENAVLIHERATCDKELVPLSLSATHLLERGDEDAAFIAETIRGWFDLHEVT